MIVESGVIFMGKEAEKEYYQLLVGENLTTIVYEGLSDYNQFLDLVGREFARRILIRVLPPHSLELGIANGLKLKMDRQIEKIDSEPFVDRLRKYSMGLISMFYKKEVTAN